MRSLYFFDSKVVGIMSFFLSLVPDPDYSIQDLLHFFSPIHIRCLSLKLSSSSSVVGILGHDIGTGWLDSRGVSFGVCLFILC